MLFVKRNITIALEEGLAREARVLAARKDTSLSQMLAQFIETIVKSNQETVSAKKDFFKRAKGIYQFNYEKRGFHRDQLHER